MQESNDDIWWIEKRDQLLDIAASNLNAYVYDLATIERAANAMLALDSVSRVLYAVKGEFQRRRVAYFVGGRGGFRLRVTG